MNLELTKDEAAFRDEVRAFLAEHLPENLRQAGRLTTSVFTDRDFNIPWHKILHAKGWAAPSCVARSCRPVASLPTSPSTST